MTKVVNQQKKMMLLKAVFQFVELLQYRTFTR